MSEETPKDEPVEETLLTFQLNKVDAEKLLKMAVKGRRVFCDAIPEGDVTDHAQTGLVTAQIIDKVVKQLQPTE